MPNKIDAHIPTDDAVRYSFLLRHLDQLLLTLDSSNAIVQASASSRQLLGYRPDELTGRSFLDMMHPDDVADASQVLAQGESLDRQLTWRLRRRLGYYVWVEVSAMHYHARDQRLLLLRDVTEQRELDLRLREEQSQTHQLNDGVRDLVARLSLEGQLLFASPAADVLLGYSPEALIGRSIYDMIHPDDRRYFRRMHRHVVKQSVSQRVRYRIRHRFGYYIWFETRARLVTDSDEAEQATIICVSRDITQFKQAQRRVHEQTRQVMLLEELGRAVTATLELDKVLDLLLIKLKPILKAESMALLLHERDELVYANTGGLFANEMRGKRVALAEKPVIRLLQQREPLLINDSRENGESNSFSDYGLYGGSTWRSGVIAPLLLGDEAIGLILALHRSPDIFDNGDLNLVEAAAHWAVIAIYNARLFEDVDRRGEQLRRLTQQLIYLQENEREQLSREIHDQSGQELTALRIELMLLKTQIDAQAPELGERLNHSLDILKGTMRRMSNLAQKLRPPALDAIGLHSALSSLCRQFQDENEIVVRYNGAEGVLSDSAEITIYRFVQETLSNVVAHAAASEVFVAMRPVPDAVVVTVSDNGRGLTKAQQERLQADDAPLGLLAMRERLELLGGRLEITSTTGVGTTVTATVPAKEL